MANTEGMSDELMSSLLTSTTGDSSKPTSKRPPSAFKRSALEKRMAMMHNDPGDRPAATVIRSSNHSRLHTDAAQVKENIPTKEQESKEAKPSSLPPVLGSVVERPLHQQKQEQRRLSPLVVSPTGLPSVHVPLGTFVKKRPNQKPKQEKNDKGESTKKDQASSRTPFTATQASSVKEASLRDADAMLAQMSREEIRESVEDLHSALSPKIIEFLKHRKQQKANKKEPSDANNRSKLESEPMHDKDAIPPVESTAQEEGRTPQQEMAVSSLNSEDDEFHQACTLLRSTSPQQVQWAARTVRNSLQQERLKRTQTDTEENSLQVFDYPILLPVSLRCLLDDHPGGGILLLHTFVLQSLYSLLCLTAPPDHVVDVTKHDDSSSSPTCNTAVFVYQEYFMDDNVLTPHLDECYNSSSVGEPLKMGKETVAYATMSSTTSAQADGEAFQNDPMWTLLSRMRILPRLAQLLSYKNLPEEAIEAVCGILTMSALRSPGAAAAIAQHTQLLPRLLTRMGLLPPTADTIDTSDEPASSKATLPALMLLNTLSRQSRVVAALLPFDLIVPPLLGQTAATREEYKVQQYALLWWRTMLRYGLGLVHVKTFVTLAVRQVSTGLLCSDKETPAHDLTLVPEYLTAFALVCDYATFARTDNGSSIKTKLSSEECEALVNTSWLSSLAKQCIKYLESGATESSETTSKLNLDTLRLHTASLRLVSSFLSLEMAVERESHEEHPVTVLDVDECLKVVRAVWKRENVREPLECTLRTLLNIDPCDVASLENEAASCSVFEALAFFLAKVANADQPEKIVQEFREWLLDTVSLSRGSDSGHLPSRSRVPKARLGWLNNTHLAICKFLSQTHKSSGTEKDLPILRSMAFTLLARLQHGQEAMADFVFRQSFLFQPVSNSPDLVTDDKASPVARMFLKELYATEKSRIQLSHSHKLLGRGIDAFDLDTLLSTADSQRIQQPLSSTELLLPLGRRWLWHVLSGAVERSASFEREQESPWQRVTQIVSCALAVLLELEHDDSFYAKQIPYGEKLYHVFNICLYPEDVVRDDRIGELSNSLFDTYAHGSNQGLLVQDFMAACCRHSQTSQRRKNSGKEEDQEKVEKLFGNKTQVEGGSSLTSSEILALENFAGDLCNAYVEYGAQYDSFTKCVRFFLRPGFPPKIRNDTINRLRPVIHLLTLPSEESDPDGPAVVSLLKSSLLGGAPDRDGSGRDSPQVLDTIASVLKRNESDSTVSRWAEPSERKRYFFLFAVALLSRNLVSSMSGVAGSIDASKRRLHNLPKESLDMVMAASSGLLSSPTGDKNDLVESVLNACVRRHPSKQTTLLQGSENLEKAIELLRIHAVK